MRLKIQIGSTYGKWTVLSFLSKKGAAAIGHKGGAAYLCECSCDKKTQRYKSSTSLLKGTSTSCGCERWNNNKLNSMAKYGVEVAAHRNEVKSKREKTNLSKYGVKNPFQDTKSMTKAIAGIDQNAKIAKTRETMLTKYGYSSNLSKNNPNRITFRQTRETIEKALDTKKSTGNGVNMLPNGLSVSEYCQKFEVNAQHANSIYREMGPAACQNYIENKETTKETYLERFFAQAMKPELDIVFFNKKVIVGGSNHRPDFVINDKLHVNVDGVLWHSDRYKKDNAYHFNKREAYEKDGKLLLQFRSDEIFEKITIVKSILMNKAGLSSGGKLMARKLKIASVNWCDASAFLDKTHLMGSGARSKAIGLYNGAELVALMTYKITGTEMEVVRYATALNTVVTGGFSKLFKNIVKSDPRIVNIVSFVDLRYGNGRSLECNGFKRVSANLSWRWVDKYSKTQNRLRCRADNMESELTKASKLGWAKIYDAGQAKYVLDLKHDNV